MAAPDTFRKIYTPLTEEQKEQMNNIKDKAQDLLDLFNDAISPSEFGRGEKTRLMAIARTNLEQTIMWAVKAVTTKDEQTD
jgi:hypothetical protein